MKLGSAIVGSISGMAQLEGVGACLSVDPCQAAVVAGLTLQDVMSWVRKSGERKAMKLGGTGMDYGIGAPRRRFDTF
jgi:hypothetical protein